MKIKLATICGAALVVGLASTAFAETLLVLDAPLYSASLTLNANGTLEYNNVAYDGVQQQDKVFDAFTVGGLTAGTPVSFTFAHVGSDDYHTISFQPVGGFTNLTNPVTWGYNIRIIPAVVPVTFQNIATDITQNVGSANVTTVATDINGDVYDAINFTKTGSSTYTGVTDQNTDNDDTNMAIVNKFTALAGTNATAFQNSFTEVAIPEASTWAMLALGFGGLGLVGFTRRKRSISIFA